MDWGENEGIKQCYYLQKAVLDVEKRICEVSYTKETKGSLKIFKLGAGLGYSPLNVIWPYLYKIHRGGSMRAAILP